MSINTLESENAQSVAPARNSELIYRLEDRPPLPQTLFAACQHLLAMFVAVITPALLICQALGLPAQDTQHIISMSLFASGVASIIQIKAWGPVGSGLLSIQGTSFNFVAPLIMGGTALKTGGADVPTMMAALFGTLMLASCTEMVISRVLHLARRIITPLVSGVVVMIIGLSLIQVGLTSIGGGYAAMSDHTFGAPKNHAAGFRCGGDDYRSVADSGRADVNWRRLCCDERSHLRRAEKPAAGGRGAGGGHFPLTPAETPP
ncbi:solute carrier family 23 protein, partial [Cronobacter sakazakii]|uniref:solute carrier family 23 protein n=1 Tax=Cronobacter sakazakii TaxID=28141 RepID=UPI003C2CBEAD